MPGAADAPSDPRACPLPPRLASYGDRIALIGNEVLTYRDLAERVADVAQRLGTARRLVLIAGANALDPIVGYLAALQAGHPVLLVPGEHADHLASMTAAYDPDVVLAPGSEGWQWTERRRGSAHELHPDLALCLTTSGSTGSPKLVRLSQAAVWANANAIATYLAIRDTDRAITSLPLHYCYGLSVLNSHLYSGAGVVLTDHSVVDPCFWDLFQRTGGTTFAGVPYTFDLLDRCGFADMDLPALRYVTQAGGRLAPERVRAYAELGQRRGWDLFVMYGQTEATARMAYLPPDLAVERPNAIGIPIPGGSFAVEPVPGLDDPGVGELVYRGPNVMLGYAETPGDLALGATITELRTGDLARRCDDGLYELAGRLSRFAKVFGLRLDLDRAERILAERGIDARCVAVDDRLTVAVEAPGEGDAARDLLARSFRIPSRSIAILRLDHLPYTGNGKPDYHALEVLARAEPTRPEPRAPLAAHQVSPAALRELYAEVLDRPEATEDSSFVSLGGDSLSYVELSVALEEALDPLPADWHTTSIRDLAARAARGAPRRRKRRVETTIAIRALAIILIVGTHVHLFSLQGSAHVLLAVAGYNFARFQLGPVPRLDRFRHGVAAAARVAVPTMVWIAAVHLLGGGYAVHNVFFLNELLGSDRWSQEWQPWFVETLIWTLLAAIALMAVPVFDRAERRWPFAFALACLAAALAARYAIAGVESTRTERITPAIAFFFVLGWAAARAYTNRHRLLLTVVLVVATTGFFEDSRREAVIIGGVLLLLWLPSVPWHRALIPATQVLASASLYIYLTHWQVIPHLREHPLLAVLASVACGIAYWLAVRPLARRKTWTSLNRWLRGLLARSRRGPTPATNTGRVTERHH